MATEACREWRGDLGVEALGRLDEPARTALLAHLDGCADCRAELRELTSVAAMLDFADVDRVVEANEPAPSFELGDRILDRLQFERARDRRRRVRRYATSIVGVAAAAVVALVLVLGHGSSPHGKVVALASAQRDVHAQVELFKSSAGTRVKLHVVGLDDGEWYWLWLTGADGHRVAAGSFAGGHAAENLTLSSAIAPDATKRVWVTDDKNHVVLDAYLH